MSLYRRIDPPNEIREFNDEEFALHPKRYLWEQYTPKPEVIDHNPPILKEEMVRGIIAKGRLAELRTAISTLTAGEQFYFTNIATFTKDDPIYSKIKAEIAK
jgi:hypothetical protein